MGNIIVEMGNIIVEMGHIIVEMGKKGDNRTTLGLFCRSIAHVICT